MVDAELPCSPCRKYENGGIASFVHALTLQGTAYSTGKCLPLPLQVHWGVANANFLPWAHLLAQNWKFIVSWLSATALLKTL